LHSAAPTTHVSRLRILKIVIAAVLSILTIGTVMLQTGATIAVASEDDDAKKKLEEAQKNFNQR